MEAKTLKWIDILRFANNGNTKPDSRVEKTEDEWSALLTPEQYIITRKKRYGTSS